MVFVVARAMGSHSDGSSCGHTATSNFTSPKRQRGGTELPGYRVTVCGVHALFNAFGFFALLAEAVSVPDAMAAAAKTATKEV
ncbi:hypothetical protein GCM10010252_26930 [Streptomyces aureoverticillatus]|nr:hypothetical protein GCM10010252_26930 [Streptomyces aureoverticillatus]